MQYDSLMALYRSPVPDFFTSFCENNLGTFNMSDSGARKKEYSKKDIVLSNVFIFVNKFREYLAKLVLLSGANHPELDFDFGLEQEADMYSLIHEFMDIDETISEDYFEEFAPYLKESQTIPSFLTEKTTGFWAIETISYWESFDEEWSEYHPLYEYFQVCHDSQTEDTTQTAKNFGALISEDKVEEFKEELTRFFYLCFLNAEAEKLAAYVLEHAETFKLFSCDESQYPNKYYYDSMFLINLLEFINNILEDRSEKTLTYRRSALQKLYSNLTKKYGLLNLFAILFPKDANLRNTCLSCVTWSRDAYTYPLTDVSVQISEAAGFFLSKSLPEVLAIIPEEDVEMRKDITDFYLLFTLTDEQKIHDTCYGYFNLYESTSNFLSVGLDGKPYYVAVSLLTSYFGLSTQSNSCVDEPRNYDVSALILLEMADKLYHCLKVYERR